MQATHFIQVYKIGLNSYQSSEPYPMAILNDCLANVPIANTVAVWRIKPTDVSLQVRLNKRFFLNSEGKPFLSQFRMFMEHEHGLKILT